MLIVSKKMQNFRFLGMVLVFSVAQTAAMKNLLIITTLMCCTALLFGQSPLNEEMAQARMHYMHQAKVSYLASAEQPTNPDWIYNETEIPSEIQAAFKLKYPQADQEQWMVKEDRYKINFRSQGEAHFAYFDRRGHWIKTFTKKSLQTMPEVIADYLNKNYQDYQTAKFYFKATPNGSGYTMALKREGRYIWLEFNTEGKVVRNQA